jgi:hypothetical protein
MSDVIYMSNVRLSFPHLVEPQKRVSPETGKERVSYSADFIMPADHAGFKAFMAKINEMALAKWKEHAAQVMQIINNDRKLRCYGDGNQKLNQKTFQPYDGYAGNVFITAGRDTAPQIIQPDGTPIDPMNTMAYQALTRQMYGGCRVNVAIKPWLQENKHGRGIRADLVAVQFAGDDQAFGEGRTDASGMFGAVAAAPAGMFGAAAPAPAFLQPAAPQQMPLPPFMTGQ